MVFESNLATLIDRLRNNPQNHVAINVNGKPIYISLRGQLPPPSLSNRIFDEEPAARLIRKLIPPQPATRD